MTDSITFAVTVTMPSTIMTALRVQNITQGTTLDWDVGQSKSGLNIGAHVGDELYVSAACLNQGSPGTITMTISGFGRTLTKTENVQTNGYLGIESSVSGGNFTITASGSITINVTP